jgi:predicted NBD/HSP70 family sugar kinase
VSRGPLVAGLDIGGTKTLAVLVDCEGEVLARARVATGGAGTEGVLASARRALEAVTEEGGASAGDLSAAGVGIPGLVDADRGTVTHAVNLGIDGRPFAIGPRLAETLRVPVAVENDVNLAALGAAVALGEGRPADLALLSVGTGVAAGVVIDGRIHRGAHGVAGEIGHLPLADDGPRCECGGVGCLEAVASGAVLAQRWPGEAPAVSLVRAAAAGDPDAVALRDLLADRLARALLLLALTFDPAALVIGGGVADAGEPLVAAVREALAALVRRSRFLAALGIPGRLTGSPGELVGALGAVEVARSGPRAIARAAR